MVKQKQNGQMEFNERNGRTLVKDQKLISPEPASGGWDFFSSHPREWTVGRQDLRLQLHRGALQGEPVA